jgi:hypothetical protein
MSKTATEETSRLKKVKSILVTQSAPADAKSPYFEIEKKYNVKVDFRPFIEVQGIAYKDLENKRLKFFSIRRSSLRAVTRLIISFVCARKQNRRFLRI